MRLSAVACCTLAAFTAQTLEQKASATPQLSHSDVDSNESAKLNKPELLESAMAVSEPERFVSFAHSATDQQTHPSMNIPNDHRLSNNPSMFERNGYSQTPDSVVSSPPAPILTSQQRTESTEAQGIETRQLTVVEIDGIELPQDRLLPRRFHRVLPRRFQFPLRLEMGVNSEIDTNTPLTDRYMQSQLSLDEWESRVRECMQARPQLYAFIPNEPDEDERRGPVLFGDRQEDEPDERRVPVLFDGQQGTVVMNSDGIPVCPLNR